MNKTCQACLEVKPVSDFYRHSMTADGFYPKCKKCHCKQCKNNRQVDIKEYRKRHRERNRIETRKASIQKPYQKSLASGEHTRRTQAWRVKNPEKYQAHLEVKKALYHGQIQKMGCVICGGKAQAHHEDYSKPLEVIWLCHTHHANHHVEKRNA